MSPEVFIGLGSNEGDRLANLRFGLKKLSDLGKFNRISSVYETEPWGLKNQPPFLNAVGSIHPTTVDPFEFLGSMQKIEIACGRKPDQMRWSQRSLDLDLLFWGDDVIDLAELQVPHPLIAARRFVLEPLAEISPEFIHPVLKQRISILLAECPDPGRVEKVAPLLETDT